MAINGNASHSIKNAPNTPSVKAFIPFPKTKTTRQIKSITDAKSITLDNSTTLRMR